MVFETECAKTSQYTVSFSLTDKHVTFYHNEKYLWKDFRDIVCWPTKTESAWGTVSNLLSEIDLLPDQYRLEPGLQ